MLDIKHAKLSLITNNIAMSNQHKYLLKTKIMHQKYYVIYINSKSISNFLL